MYNYTLSQIAGVLTLVLMVISYLFKSKSMFLFFQGLGVFAMLLSYLFGEQYFAMITIAVSITRTATFYIYEKKDKEAPIAFAYLFAFLAICAYFIVNLLILKTANPLDILHLTAQASYAFLFRMRDIQFVRRVIIIPHCLAILYNLLLGGMLFVALSYVFELLADLYALFKYRSKDDIEETKEIKEAA